MYHSQHLAQQANQALSFTSSTGEWKHDTVAVNCKQRLSTQGSGVTSKNMDGFIECSRRPKTLWDGTEV